jgi:hypothetical protein
LCIVCAAIIGVEKLGTEIDVFAEGRGRTSGHVAHFEIVAGLLASPNLPVSVLKLH